MWCDIEFFRRKPFHRNPKNKKITYNYDDWGKYPKNVFGWFLWMFPKKHWRKMIWVGVIVIGIAIALPAYFLITLRQLEIDSLREQEIEKYWEKNLQYWERAAPEWKSALLNIWSEPDDVPKKIWDLVKNETHIQVHIAAAGHPNVPVGLRERLIEDALDLKVKIAGILNRQNRKDAIDRLYREKTIRKILFEELDVTLERFKKLQKELDVQDYRAICKNDNAPHEVLRLIANSLSKDDTITLNTLASNLNTPLDILDKLSMENNAVARSTIISLKETPASILLKLLKHDKDEFILEGIASHLNTPYAELVKLSKNLNPKVRSAVAANEIVKPDLLESLSTDSEPLVRSTVAGSLNVTPAILDILSEDPEAVVRSAVAGSSLVTPEILIDLSKDSEPIVRSAVAGSSKVTPTILADLSKDPEPLVRSTVAGSSKVTPAILANLSNAPEPLIRSSVAKNEKTKAELLEKLSDEKKEVVLIAVAGNKKTPPKILRALLKKPKETILSRIAYNPSTPIGILKELSIDHHPLVREMVTQNQNVSAIILSKLSFDNEPSVVASVAKNHLTPIDDLKRLATSREEDVWKNAILKIVSLNASQWK